MVMLMMMWCAPRETSKKVEIDEANGWLKKLDECICL